MTNFGDMLDAATLEEEIQVFLKDNPEYVYPYYLKCHPKFPLGADYVTDFVFLIQGLHGEEYVFVEIEKASKKIFTQTGQFTSEFAQARQQLLDWETWITYNHAFLRRDLPDLFKPKFHLIMGRSTSFTQTNRETLSNAQELNKIYSTYDDIKLHFMQALKRLSPLSPP